MFEPSQGTMNRYLALFLLSVLLVACRPTTSSSPTPLAAEPTVSRPEPTPTPNSPTPTPIPLSPTPTAIPPTLTPSLTATPTPTVTPPPTKTPRPTATPTPINLSLGPFRAVAPLPSFNLSWMLYLSADDQLWLVGDTQVIRLVSEQWQPYVSYSGEFRGIDSSGRVWVLADDDLVHSFDAQGETIYDQSLGWSPVEWMEKIELDGSGRVWVQTSEGVRYLDNGQWVTVSSAEMGFEVIEDENYETTFGLFSNNGQIWVTHCYWGGPGPAGGLGARWFDGQSWQGGDLAIDDCVFDGTSDNLGQVWLGGQRRVWRYASGRLDAFAFPQAPAGSNGFGFVSHLIADSAGQPWITLSVCGGASCFAGEILYTIEGSNWIMVNGWNGTYPAAVQTDSEGNKWFINGSGIFQWQNNQLNQWTELGAPTRITTHPNLPSLWFAAPYQFQALLWHFN